MKKLLGGTTLVVLLCLTMTLFTSNSVQAQNGVNVEIVKNGDWFLMFCGEKYYSESSTLQIKDDNPHMATLIFIIPTDACIIEKKAYTMYVGPFKVKVTPSGMVIAKFINNSGEE